MKALGRKTQKAEKPVGSLMAVKCLLLLTGLTFAWVSVSGERGPHIPQGKGDHCVADTDFMRRNHMDLILHQRDDTVIRGLRDKPFSLVECVDCHARSDSDGKAVRIDAKGEFCASCHEYVAVSIDCFSCHAAVPEVTHEDSAQFNEQVHLLAKRLQTTSKPPQFKPPQFGSDSTKSLEQDE